MTNREAAAALFLSPKTIEYHLGQIYRKLDVRGRAQLARLMAMELPEGERDPAVLADALLRSAHRARGGRAPLTESGVEVSSWATDDLEQQRGRRAVLERSKPVERAEQLVVGLDPARLAALGAGHRGDVDPSSAGHGPSPPARSASRSMIA